MNRNCRQNRSQFFTTEKKIMTDQTFLPVPAND